MADRIPEEWREKSREQSLRIVAKAMPTTMRSWNRFTRHGNGKSRKMLDSKQKIRLVRHWSAK